MVKAGKKTKKFRKHSTEGIIHSYVGEKGILLLPTATYCYLLLPTATNISIV